MKNNKVIVIIITGVIVIGMYFLAFKNNSPSSPPVYIPSSSVSRPSPITTVSSSPINSYPISINNENINDLWRQKENEKETIEEIKKYKILKLQNQISSKNISEFDLINKKSELRMQIKDIELREIPNANIDIEFNQQKIKNAEIQKQKLLQKKSQTSENIEQIKKFDAQISQLQTDISDIETKISEFQIKSKTLQDELQKINEYEVECKKIEAEYQQKLNDLEEKYKN
ncbi:hypothetical protein [Candidatus Phytoplasma prunorum]|uniref:hypothetical protein n=1 Tax=Candidatus Phytoplasma prunorum TaxID=47565 RepID=UPI002FF02A31